MGEEATPLRLAILGASGGVGRRVVALALERGCTLACQTRDAEKLESLADRVRICVCDPSDCAGLASLVEDADLVVYALGVDGMGATRLFSQSTAALLEAMKSKGVPRLIAVTGVGAGETRGHGGLLYNRIIFPLFTKKRYLDKDRQEALIATSDLEWIIVRPAPFQDRQAPGELQVHTRIEKDTQLRRITRDEVAAFIVAQFESDRYLHQRPFIGHP